MAARRESRGRGAGYPGGQHPNPSRKGHTDTEIGLIRAYRDMSIDMEIQKDMKKKTFRGT